MNLETATRNPLLGRADVERLLRDLLAPLPGHFTPGRAGLRLGDTRATYGEPAGLLEAFARPLWGLVPLAMGGGRADDLWPLWREGLDHGTDPDHPEFWGRIGDLDQRMVEATILALGACLAGDRFWAPLAPAARTRAAAWLAGINSARPVDNNWLFFRVIVNASLRMIGGDWSAKNMESDLRRIDQFYLGGGWYSDGEWWRGDYYVPMAMHLYGLIYAQIAEGSDPARAAIFRGRAREFAPDFLHWFAAEGSAVPFGRSLTYRFAQGSFWGALAFAGVEALPWGVMKGLYLRHLRRWMRKPILSDSGLLTIGYDYPNLIMAEGYNAPGSPYWAFKAFLPLALPDGHPFWRETELPMPPRKSVHTVPAAGKVLMTDGPGTHVIALNAGQALTGWHRHTARKYSKFAYSTHFAFSVAVGRSDDLADGGFDSTLALSDDGVRFRHRERCLDASVARGAAYSLWRPWDGVEVRTWLIAADTLHLRVHRLTTSRPLWSAETGFAAGYESPAQVSVSAAVPGAITLQTPQGGGGLRDLAGARVAERILLEPNTNLASPLAAMPVLRGVHRPGGEWLVCAVGGWLDSGEAFASEAGTLSVETGADRLAIARGGKPFWSVDLKNLPGASQ
jgi:hypothetical protein